MQALATGGKLLVRQPRLAASGWQLSFRARVATPVLQTARYSEATKVGTRLGPRCPSVCCLRRIHTDHR